MMDADATPPSVSQALRECADASQTLMANRLQLFEYDLRTGLDDTLRRGARYSLSGLFALAGAGALALAAGLSLCQVVSPPVAASLVGASLLGVAAVLWPRHSVHLPRHKPSEGRA